MLIIIHIVIIFVVIFVVLLRLTDLGRAIILLDNAVIEIGLGDDAEVIAVYLNYAVVLNSKL